MTARYLGLFEDLTGSLLRDGENYIVCPLHQGSHQNFAVNTEKGLWICHRGCGEGNARMLAGVVLGLSPLRAAAYVEQFQEGEIGPSSVDELLERMRASDEQEGEQPVFVRDMHNLTETVYPNWWPERGFNEHDWERWQVTMDRGSGDVVLPVYDLAERCVGEIRRRMPGVEPKYLHSAGFRKAQVLYGSWLFPSALRSDVVLVEGPLDAVWLWRHGWPALAVLGSQVSEHQVGLLRQLGVDQVVLAFDNDGAGQTGMHKSLTRLAREFSVRVVNWEDHMAGDVQELPSEQLERLLVQAVPGLTYAMGVQHA